MTVTQVCVFVNLRWETTVPLIKTTSMDFTNSACQLSHLSTLIINFHMNTTFTWYLRNWFQETGLNHSKQNEVTVESHIAKEMTINLGKHNKCSYNREFTYECTSNEVSLTLIRQVTQSPHRLEKWLLACCAGDCWYFRYDWSSTLDHGGSDGV